MLANRKATEDALISYPVDHVVFLGHGDRNGEALIGYEGNPIIDKYNVQLTRDKGCYFICSQGAKLLGQQAVKHGAKFFLGFTDKFYLTTTVTEPIISECAISGLLELLKECEPAIALDRMKDHHAQWIDRLETEQDKIDPEWFLTAAILRANIQSLTLIMDPPPSQR